MIAPRTSSRTRCMRAADSALHRPRKCSKSLNLLPRRCIVVAARIAVPIRSRYGEAALGRGNVQVYPLADIKRLVDDNDNDDGPVLSSIMKLYLRYRGRHFAGESTGRTKPRQAAEIVRPTTALVSKKDCPLLHLRCR